MSDLLDMRAFRQAIGHDEEMEQVLLQLFIECSDEALATLRPTADDKIWHDSLHQMKGAALNIGATALVNVITRSDTIAVDAIEERQAALSELQSCYGELRGYVMQCLA